MNSSLEKALLKQKIRRSHGLIIKEQSTLYSTFVEPFKDAFTAIKLGTQDVLNAARLAWDTISLSPKKINAAREKFKERESAIAEKWKPLMDKNMKALKRGDADFLAMVFAPGLTLATAASVGAVKAAGGTMEYLEDSGWKVPLLSGIGLQVQTRTSDDGGPYKAPPEQEKNMLQKLAGLFYIEHAWLDGEVLLEATDDKPESFDFKSELSDWMEATGIAAAFEESAKDYIEATRENLEVIKSESIPKIAALVSMSRSSDLENFSKSALALKDSGIEGDINVEEISSKVKEAAQELSKSEEFKKQAEAQGSPADKNKILQAAEKSAFQQMKSDFDKKVNQTIQSLRQQALEEIENLSPDEQNTSAIKQTKLGIKLLKLIEDAKLSIQNA